MPRSLEVRVRDAEKLGSKEERCGRKKVREVGGLKSAIIKVRGKCDIN
jgi:hypothetical protein